MKIVIIGNFPDAAKEQIKNRFPEDWEVKFLLSFQKGWNQNVCNRKQKNAEHADP